MSVEEIIARYAEVARPLILQFTGPHSCIAAARTTIECLRLFGVPALALPVRWSVYCREKNFAYVSGLDPETKAKAQNAAAVFIDQGTPSTWDGHLVVVAGTGSKRYLIDASFDQASAPEYGVTIHPMVLVVPINDATIPSGSIAATLQLQAETGEIMEVDYVPSGDHSFESAPAWGTDHLQILIALICRRMRTTA